MDRVFDFTGNCEADWNGIRPIWQESEYVMSGAVGALWVMPPQHKVCLEFAETYPESKEFLISRLADPDPRIAAYAFKTLIRVGEFKLSDIPSAVMARTDEIIVIVHSRGRRQTLHSFFSDYFDSEDPKSVTAADERAVSWQDNELARYLEATRGRDRADQNSPGETK